MRRTWSKTAAPETFKRVLVRYDFGTHEGWLTFSPGTEGFLTECSWKCWKILSTTQIGEEVVQELLEMPEDFCCMKAYSIETLPFADGCIPGWKITDEANNTSQILDGNGPQRPQQSPGQTPRQHGRSEWQLDQRSEHSQRRPLQHSAAHGPGSRGPGPRPHQRQSKLHPRPVE